MAGGRDAGAESTNADGRVLPGMPWGLPWPFDRTYMQLALLAGVVVGAAAPLIGVFIVQKGLSLMGDGIGHVAVAGHRGQPPASARRPRGPRWSSPSSPRS